MFRFQAELYIGDGSGNGTTNIPLTSVVPEVNFQTRNHDIKGKKNFAANDSIPSDFLILQWETTAP